MPTSIAPNVCDFNRKYITVNARSKNYVIICEEHGPSPRSSGPGVPAADRGERITCGRSDPISRGPGDPGIGSDARGIISLGIGSDAWGIGGPADVGPAARGCRPGGCRPGGPGIGGPADVGPADVGPAARGSAARRTGAADAGHKKGPPNGGPMSSEFAAELHHVHADGDVAVRDHFAHLLPYRQRKVAGLDLEVF